MGEKSRRVRHVMVNQRTTFSRRCLTLQPDEYAILTPGSRRGLRSFAALRLRSGQALRRRGFYRAYKIFFPNADSASSTARSAVRLCSSMTGLTSTISKLVMRPWSAMISIARCASR